MLDPSSKVQTPVAPCLSLSWIPHQQCGLSLFPPRCPPRVVNGLPPPRCLGTQPSSRLPLLLPGDHLLPRLPSEGRWDLSGSLPLPLRGQAFVHAATLPSCSCCSLCPGPQPRPTPASCLSTLLLRSPPGTVLPPCTTHSEALHMLFFCLAHPPPPLRSHTGTQCLAREACPRPPRPAGLRGTHTLSPVLPGLGACSPCLGLDWLQSQEGEGVKDRGVEGSREGQLISPSPCFLALGPNPPTAPRPAGPCTPAPPAPSPAASLTE